MVIATMLVMHHIMAKAVIVLSLQSPLLSYDVLARRSGARICSEDFLRYEMLENAGVNQRQFFLQVPPELDSSSTFASFQNWLAFEAAVHVLDW